MSRNLCLHREKRGAYIMKGLLFFFFFSIFCLSQCPLSTAILDIHPAHQEAGLKKRLLQDQSPKDPLLPHPTTFKAVSTEPQSMGSPASPQYCPRYGGANLVEFQLRETEVQGQEQVHFAEGGTNKNEGQHARPPCLKHSPTRCSIQHALAPATTLSPGAPDACSLVALPQPERNTEKCALELGSCSSTQD